MSTKRERITRLYLPGSAGGAPAVRRNEGLYPFLPSTRRFFSLLPRAREARSEGSSVCVPPECVPCAPREREPWVGQPAAHGNPWRLGFLTKRPRGYAPVRVLRASSTAASSFSPSSSFILRATILFPPSYSSIHFSRRQDLTGVLIDFMVLWRAPRPRKRNRYDDIMSRRQVYLEFITRESKSRPTVILLRKLSPSERFQIVLRCIIFNQDCHD